MLPASEEQAGPLRFELTPEQTARFSEWAATIQKAHRDEGMLGPAEITICFRMAGALGIEITAHCGASVLVLQAIEG